MKEDNLILKAVKSEKQPTEIDIKIKKGTYGFELYRIICTLIKYFITQSPNSKLNEEQLDLFFEKLKKDFKVFYNR